MEQFEDIRRSFGDNVASLVEGASEPDKSDTWENQKRHTIEYLKTAPPDVVLVSLADKLDNIRAIRQDYEKLGDALWARFNRPKESQAWYYRSLAGVFASQHCGAQFSTLVHQFNAEARVADPEKGQSFRICVDDKIKLGDLKGLHLKRDDLFICRDAALDDEAAANLALQCRLKTI